PAQLICLEGWRGRQRVDCGAHLLGQGIDEARFAGVELTGYEQSQGFGSARSHFGLVTLRLGRDVTFELLCRHPEPSAIEIDRGPAHLLDKALSQLANDVLAADLVHAPRKLLTDLVGRGAYGIEQTDNPPEVVRAFGIVDQAAPAIELNELADCDLVPERNVFAEEGSQLPGNPFD